MLLIVAWLRKGKVCLIDLDPQRSAEKWWQLRAAKAAKNEPVIQWGMAGNLKEMLAAAEQKGVALSLVDTAGAIDRTLARAAAEANLVIIPTRTSQLDVQSLADTLGYLEDTKALGKAVIVINATRANEDAAAVRALAERYRVPVASIVLRDRAQYSKALDEGRGITEKSARSEAARDIQELFDWLEAHDASFATAPARETV